MTQNQASLRWKKPGFEQKFLMQGEKQVPETSGCRRFYSGPNINFHLYAYAGNSPVRYTDPDGKFIVNTKRNYTREFMQDYNLTWPDSNETIASTGCSLIASNRAVNAAIADFGYSFDTPEPSSITSMLDNNSVTSSEGMIFGGLKDYLANFGVNAEVIDSKNSFKDMEDIAKLLKYAQESSDAYLVIGQITEGDSIHFVNINYYNADFSKVTAYDTSRNTNGQEKRNLKNSSIENFNRLILIKINSLNFEF